MFRVTFLCEDKNLPKVLHGINGLVFELDTRVAAAAVVEGKVKSTTPEGGSWGVILKAFPPGTEFTTKEGKAVLEEAGYKASSWHSSYQRMLKDGVAVTVDRGLYRIKEVKGGKAK